MFVFYVLCVRCMHRYEDNIKMNLKGIEYEVVDVIQLGHNRLQ